jgi:hypothetical protein
LCRINIIALGAGPAAAWNVAIATAGSVHVYEKKTGRAPDGSTITIAGNPAIEHHNVFILTISIR